MPVERRKQMGRVTMKWVVLALLVIFMAIPLAAMAAGEITIEGQVNDNFQLVDGNGQVFEVADTVEGNDLVENHIGEKAKVTGTIEQDQEIKIITVTTFKIISE
jgi:hypothetical protein